MTLGCSFTAGTIHPSMNLVVHRHADLECTNRKPNDLCVGLIEVRDRACPVLIANFIARPVKENVEAYPNRRSALRLAGDQELS
jgi:hypothetical protein